MPDSQIRCSDCGELFLFSEQEQAFFAEKGLNTPPKRCKTCRQARKTAGPGGAAGGGFGGRDRDRGPSPDRRGFRPNDAPARGNGFAPRSGGGGFAPRSGGGGFAPRSGGGGFAPREGGGGFAPRESGGGFAPRESGGGFGPRAGAGGGGFAPRGGGYPARGAAARPEPRGEGGWRPRNGAPAGPSAAAPRAGGWKTPHAPDAGGSRARDTRDRSFTGASAHEAPRAEAAKPAARERAAKPKFDITCAECGAPSQVPFKPLEGRQVYCQPCYRLRKIASPEALEPVDVDANGGESGIVE